MSDCIQLKESDLFVVYRMPNSNDYYLMEDMGIVDAEYQFVIHPFDKHGTTQNIALKSDQLIENEPFSFTTEKKCDVEISNKDAYLQLAKDVITEMNTSGLEKVVLSRIHQVDAGGVDIFNLFNNLMATYPTAFIYLYNIPGEGTWMGATPEILMERNLDVITTVALAATQKADGRSIKEVIWNDKEKEEQAIIQRYIEDHLDKADLAFSKGETTTSLAGNVYHIKTVYNIPKMLSTDELVDQLHPGPAICGMPKAEAKARIIDGESHDRQYYCGYLGLKTKGRTSLFINLRCMQVFRDQFALYVGGGLTKDSTPESEWEETSTKSKTLESVIQKSYIYVHDD